MSTPSTPKEEPSPFERMKALAQKVVTTPKTVVEEREKEWRNAREDQKKSGPKVRH